MPTSARRAVSRPVPQGTMWVGRVWDPPLHTAGRDVGGKCPRPELAGDAPSSVWPSASHLPPEGEGFWADGIRPYRAVAPL